MNATTPLRTKNGTIECHMPHQEAYFDSYLTCIAFIMPHYLERLYFGHLSFIFNTAVLLISIFGNIKQTYKYFFINQALWDILLSYDFICDRPTNARLTRIKPEIRSQWDEQPSNCIYIEGANSNNMILFFVYSFIIGSIINGPYCSTFLLSFSRFLAIFFHRFYQKFVTPIKVTIFIGIFSIIYIFLRSLVNFYPLIFAAINSDRCKQLWCPNSSICPINYTDCTIAPLFQESYLTFFLSFATLSALTPAVLVILTMAFMIANLSKIFLQLYRQYKLKQKLIFSNFKIAVVLAAQCLTLFFIFLVRDFMSILTALIPYNLRASWWPSWQAHVDYKSFTILKSVIDSIITLTVLTEYRQNIVRAFKFILQIILKPFTRYQLFASLKSETSSTVLFQKSTSKIKLSK